MQASRPRSPLRAFFPSPPPAKAAQKGPAFWSNSVVASWPLEEVPAACRKAHSKAPQIRLFFGTSSWGQFLALVLVATALFLFSLLMGFLGLYIQKADKLNAKIPQMKSWEQRLNDAIKREAGPHSMFCKLCWDYTWLQWGGGCYHRTELLMPWKTCIRKCKRFGAKLLKSTTEGEMEFILRESRKWYSIDDHSHPPEKTWIGLIFDLSEKTWRWADGEFLHIRLPVKLNQPFTPREFCVMVSSGQAFTNNCTERISCLCKREIH